MQEGQFEFEYIVRDGCSNDRTLEILSEYEGSLPVVSKKDDSPREAIKAGLSMVSDEIRAWLNADDVYEPGGFGAPEKGSVSVGKRFCDITDNRQWLKKFKQISDIMRALYNHLN